MPMGAFMAVGARPIAAVKVYEDDFTTGYIFREGWSVRHAARRIAHYTKERHDHLAHDGLLVKTQKRDICQQ